MPIWFYLLMGGLGAFMGYEIWRSRAFGKISIAYGDVSKRDSPRMFTFLRAFYVFGLVLNLLSTTSILLSRGVKI